MKFIYWISNEKYDLLIESLVLNQVLFQKLLLLWWSKIEVVNPLDLINERIGQSCVKIFEDELIVLVDWSMNDFYQVCNTK